MQHCLIYNYLLTPERLGNLGTIYIAFGTYPDWNYAPKRIIDALFGAFQRLTEYRIIFVYNGDAPMKLGQHIRLIKWAPKLELLAHPKTLAFITHGGMKRLYTKTFYVLMINNNTITGTNSV